MGVSEIKILHSKLYFFPSFKNLTWQQGQGSVCEWCGSDVFLRQLQKFNATEHMEVQHLNKLIGGMHFPGFHLAAYCSNSRLLSAFPFGPKPSNCPLTLCISLDSPFYLSLIVTYKGNKTPFLLLFPLQTQIVQCTCFQDCQSQDSLLQDKHCGTSVAFWRKKTQ